MRFRDHILNGLKDTKIPKEALQNLGEDFGGFNHNPKPLTRVEQYSTERVFDSKT